jgi:DNA transposition AAA+ family ATPase
MKESFIETRNYIRLLESFTRLENLPKTAPKMGLGYGNFGLGKTFSLERIAAKKNALLLRAVQTWSKKALLEKMCFELGLSSEGGSSRMYERVVEDLRREARILIIDEVDALLRSEKYQVLELLRDIHDETHIVVYCIGMEEANAKLKRHRHYYSRIVEFVEFKPIAREDVERFCALADLKIELDLVEYFATKYPNLRQIRVLLLRLEEAASRNDVDTVDLATFKKLGVEHVGRE